MDTTTLEALQFTLAQQVEIPTCEESYIPKKGDIVFSFDVQYENSDAYVAIDVLKWEENTVGVYVTKQKEEAEYVPGFFAFREGPTLLKAMELLKQKHELIPDLIIVDGHGLAHPRKFGVACWLGIKTGIPTIGCAKRALVKYEGTVERMEGSILEIENETNETIGAVLRTQTDVKPIFVSVGHRISLPQAIHTILHLRSAYRIIEPIRRADQACRRFAKGEVKDLVVLD